MTLNKLLAIWRRLTSPPNSVKEPERRYQARLMASLVFILFPLGITAVIIVVITSPARSLVHDRQLQIMLFSSIILPALYLLSRGKNHTFSVFLTLFLGIFVVYLTSYVGMETEALFALYYLSILILISGFLLPIRFAIMFAILAIAPMTLSSWLIPAVSLHNIIAGPFSLVVIASVAALLISHYHDLLEQQRRQQSTELLNKLTHRTNQLAALQETSIGILAHRDINELLHTIATRAAKLLGVAGGSIYLVNSDGVSLTLTAVVGLGENLQGLQLRRGEDMAGRIMITGQPQIITNYDQWTGRSTIFHANLIGNAIQVPILLSGNVIGVLSCQEAASVRHTFTPADIQLLEGLAQQSAIALQNSYLFTEEQMARHQAERLQAAAQALSGSLVLQDVFENILVELRKVVPYDSASVQQLKNDRYLEIIGGHGFPNLEEILGVRFDLTSEDNPNRLVIQSCSPILLADVPTVYAAFKRDPYNKTVIHSWLGAPLIFGNQIKGMLALGKREIGFYTQEHARLVNAFAAQAAVAIENAILYEEARRRAFELETLAQISASLRTAKSVAEMIPILLQKTVEAIKATYSVLFLADPETDELVSQFSWPLDFYRSGLRQLPGSGITGHVATTRKIYISEDIGHDPLLFLLPGERDCFQGTESAISVPLQTQEKVIGVMHIGSIEKRTFTEADIRLITSVSNIAANALNRATVLDTLEERVADRTQELARANARLKELDALKTKFISDISHELRTPVATLNLYMDLLERGKPEKKPKYMEILQQKTDVLVRLTEDILNISRLNLYDGGLKFTAVDLNDTVSVVIAMHRERAQAADIQLTFTPASNLPPIRAERNQLLQAINNIVANALNYTQDGSVRVTTYPLIESRQAGLQITDTGIGIPANEIPYIFERFYRGQEVGQSNIPGTGLGLAIVKEIVNLHKGAIDVESELGKGSAFSIVWPLADKLEDRTDNEPEGRQKNWRAQTSAGDFRRSE
ncbi:MAG: GAF domain-containing protein [Chloroflexi bacterium]|nr:GAF domain-containing protein [Chloroflexota bacterium]